MTFDELWSQVSGLPDTAIQQVPQALSIDTKKRLAEFSPEQIRDIISEAIDNVNHGSIQALDFLVKKRLI